MRAPTRQDAVEAMRRKEHYDVGGEVAKYRESVDDWTASCRFCGGTLKGTLAQLKGPCRHCGHE